MRLIDLLNLLKCCSTDYVTVSILYENDKSCRTYHGFASELLKKIKMVYLCESVVVNYKNGYTIGITCVL